MLWSAARGRQGPRRRARLGGGVARPACTACTPGITAVLGGRLGLYHKPVGGKGRARHSGCRAIPHSVTCRGAGAGPGGVAPMGGRRGEAAPPGLGVIPPQGLGPETTASEMSPGPLVTSSRLQEMCMDLCQPPQGWGQAGCRIWLVPFLITKTSRSHCSDLGKHKKRQ